MGKNWLKIKEAKRAAFIAEFRRIYKVHAVSILAIGTPTDGHHLELRQKIGGTKKIHTIMRVGIKGRVVPEGPFTIRWKDGVEIPNFHRDMLLESCKEIKRRIR